MIKSIRIFRLFFLYYQFPIIFNNFVQTISRGYDFYLKKKTATIIDNFAT